MKQTISQQAIKMLEGKDFNNLVNLKGGILAWRDAFDSDMIVY
jgi:rhodanese-related sulfurtransferase